MMLRRIVLIGLVCAICLPAFGCDGAGEEAETTSADATTTAPVSKGAVKPEKLLTPADVQRISGLTDLKVVPYDPAVGAGGDVNIANSSGQLVVMLIVEGPEVWDEWLTDGFTVAESVTPPVGDESFIGPNPDTSAATYIFGFRKGDVAVVLDTYPDAAGEMILSIEQLQELAVIVEGRL